MTTGRLGKPGRQLTIKVGAGEGFQAAGTLRLRQEFRSGLKYHRQWPKNRYSNWTSRVGGAHIADLVEAATGINLWAEWARVEIGTPYALPPVRGDYAALLVSLARQQDPDTSGYTDPEIVWRMDREHHVGFIVKSPSYARVQEVLASLTERVQRDFQASAPPKDRPTG